MDEESIFMAALDKATPEERSAFLNEACKSNDQLRHSIEQLLRAHEKAGAFLQQNALENFDDAKTGCFTEQTSAAKILESTGVTVGPYKLLQQIGEGGMGVVFMAEQNQPVQRFVALKIIKPGMDSRQVIARFEAERQALALMDHPNIAKVLDGGATEMGRPFFVMELVKGIPITNYCDELRLSPRERLKLFIPVCNAVQHAHQKGIIHRDLKPSNVMIALYDGKPVAKIIDFGVAKATGPKLTDKTLFTEFGSVVGTLEYMSPEQAELNQLDIDTRSDIYSLGVLLYELLTGTTPLQRETLKQAAIFDLLRIIREVDPPKPSLRLSATDELPTIAAKRKLEPKKLDRFLRGELDWIVMKCLEKVRNRRYPTANDLALDIQRFLDDEPVLASPPSFAYRIRKLLRRNKKLTALASVVLLMALFGVAVVAGSIGWVQRNRQALEAVAAEEKIERDKKRERQIESALGETQDCYRLHKLVDARAALKRAQELLAGGRVSQAMSRKVQQWSKDLEMVARLEEIRIRQGLGIKDGRFDTGGADAEYADAFKEYGLDQALLTPHEAAKRIKSSAICATFTAALDDWLIARTKAQGLKKIGQILEVARLADTDAWRIKLRDAYRHNDAATLEELAKDQNVYNHSRVTIILLARALASAKKYAVAIKVLREAQHRNQGDFWINQFLGYHLIKSDEDNEALTFLRAAAALRPDSPGAQNNLGVVLERLKRLPEAEKAYQRAVELQQDYSEAWAALGSVLDRQWKLTEAEAAFQKAIELKKDYSYGYVRLGTVYSKQKKDLLAEAILRQMLHLPPANNGAKQFLSQKGEEQVNPILKEHHNGVKQFFPQKGEEQLSPILNEYHDEAWVQLGFIYERQHQYQKMEEAFAKAIGFGRKDAHAYSFLGVARAKQKKWAEAGDAFRQAVQMEPEKKEYLTWLKRCAWQVFTSKAKTPALDKALGFAKTLVEVEPNNGGYLTTLGMAYYRHGDWSSAVMALKTALKQKDGSGPASLLQAMAYWKLGDKENAVRLYAEALEELVKHQPKYDLLVQRVRAEAEELVPSKIVMDWYNAAIKADDQSPLLYTGRAMALARQGHFDSAADDFKKAFDLLPDTEEGKAVRESIHGQIAPWLEVVRRVAKMLPDSQNLWLETGRYHALRGRWKFATEHYSEAFAPKPHVPSDVQYCCLLLLNKDLQGYRNHCQSMIARGGDSSNGIRQYLLAYACGLHSSASGVDTSQLLGWAKSGVDQKTTKFTVHVLAVASLRNGQYQKAIDFFDQGMAVHNEGKSKSAFPLAIAYHHLGKKQEAREWYKLGKGELHFQTVDPDAPATWAVIHWLEVNVWYREAKAIFEPEDADPEKKTIPKN